jgi:hypothetical protein
MKPKAKAKPRHTWSPKSGTTLKFQLPMERHDNLGMHSIEHFKGKVRFKEPAI